MTSTLLALIEDCKRGKQKAQSRLYALCFPELMPICARYKNNRDDAVALLNSAFLKILLQLKEYDVDRPFFAWANTLTVRTAIDDFRVNKRYLRDTVLYDQDFQLEELQPTNLDSQDLSILDAESLREMTFKLEDLERLVFNLYYGEDYKHAEIAASLEISERSSKRHLKSARLKLAEMVQQNVKQNRVAP